MEKRFWAFIGLVGVMACADLHAQETVGDDPVQMFTLTSLSLTDESPKSQPHDDPFARGTCMLQITGSYLMDDNDWGNHAMNAGYAALGVSYYAMDNLAIGAEIAGYGLSFNDPSTSIDVGGAGFNIIGRWHFLRLGKLAFHVDAAAGLVEFDKDFPPGGTRFNFIERAGVGTTWQLGEDSFLIGGMHLFHISNADLWTADRNPAMDGWELYIGLMFRL